MAQPARTARLAALFTLMTCSLLAPPVAAQEKQDPPPPAAVRPALDEADQLDKAGKPLEAIAVLEKRLAGLPRDTPTAERRALSLALADRYAAQAVEDAKAKRSKEAIAWYEKAFVLHRPWNTGAAASDLNKIGSIYNALTQYDRALEYYNQALPLFRTAGDKRGEANALYNIGLVSRNLSQYDRALEFYDQALTIYRKLGLQPEAADTLNAIGTSFRYLSKYDGALEFYNQALPIYRQLGNKPKEAQALNSIGSVYKALAQYGKAQEFYNQALTVWRAIDDKLSEADALYNIALVSYNLLQYDRAVEHYNQALPLYRQLGRRQDEADTLSEIGRAYDSLSKYDRALESYNQALPIYRQLGNKSGEARVLNNIGAVYQSLAQYTRTLDFYNQALPIYRQAGDRKGEAWVLNNIGMVYYRLAQYTRALEFFNQSLPIRQVIGGKADEADTLNNIADAYRALAQYPQALDYCSQALIIYRHVNDKQGERNVFQSMGNIYYFLSQFDKSLGFYNQALAIDRQRGNKVGEAGTLNNIGNVYASSSQYDRALEFLNQALTIYRQLSGAQREANLQGEAVVLHNVGRAYIGLSQYAKALESTNQSVEIYRRVDDKAGEGKALHTIGEIYDKRSEFARSLEFFKQSLTIYQRIGDRSGEADIHNHLMNLYDHAKNPSLAIWYGKQAVNLYQTIRGMIRTLDKEVQQGYASSFGGVYRHLADLLISQGRLTEAQQVLDLLKQQEYFTFIRRSPAETDAANGTTDLTPAEAEAEKKYRAVSDRAITVAAEYETLLKKQPRTEAEEKRLDELFKELAEANAAFQTFLTGLEKEFAVNKTVANRLDTVKDAEALTTTLARLDEDTGQKTVAVYTLVGEKTLRFLVITGGVQVARTANIGAADLARKVFAFRTALKNPRLDPRPLGKELYDLLIKPIEKDLTGANAATILWSLDGVLRYIPLAALSPDGKTYLAERDIRHSLFTPATLSRLVNAPKADWKALAVGVSKPYEVEGVHFNALAGAESEVNGVEALLPGRILMNADFNETALVRALRDGYPLVHVATHFYFRPGDEGRSFLLLGDGTALSLAHLREMPATLFKGVDLLVLSACDTATGGGEDPSATGAEFESFGLLAQRKGAEAVLATLWPVADASTVLLMQEFYRIRKATPGLSKAAALRQAQIALLTGKVTPPPFTGPESIKGVAASTESEAASNAPAYVPDPRRPYAHPYYWAGFILIGNFR